MGKHHWKVYLSVIPGEPVEREIACADCGLVLTEENEHEDNCGEEELEWW